VSPTGQSLNDTSVPIARKEIDAFLLTCRFGRVIGSHREGLAGLDDILINPTQNIIKIYILQIIHYARVITIFWWKQVGMWRGNVNSSLNSRKGNPLGWL
jgi:hypothetical protein